MLSCGLIIPDCFFCGLQRITIAEIRNHQWFLKNLPADLAVGTNAPLGFDDVNHPPQSIEDIMRILQEARTVPPGQGMGGLMGDNGLLDEDMDLENELDFESSGDFVCQM